MITIGKSKVDWFRSLASVRPVYRDGEQVAEVARPVGSRFGIRHEDAWVILWPDGRKSGVRYRTATAAVEAEIGTMLTEREAGLLKTLRAESAIY